jgi:hypothetical protein
LGFYGHLVLAVFWGVLLKTHQMGIFLITYYAAAQALKNAGVDEVVLAINYQPKVCPLVCVNLA